MKKILMIILGVVVALFIIGFGVVKFYIEPNLDTILDDVDEGLSEAIQDYEDETYKETVEVNMADLMKEFEKDADEAEEKYIDKILVVTADLNKAEEFYAYEEYDGETNKPILKTNILCEFIFYSDDKEYIFDIDSTSNNDDFVDEDSFRDEKLQKKYDMDKLIEKGTITFKCLGLYYDGDEKAITLNIREYPAK